ncbi:MAG: hypothetical protein ACRDQ5_13475 [Sciscionella sp.]
MGSWSLSEPSWAAARGAAERVSSLATVRVAWVSSASASLSVRSRWRGSGRYPCRSHACDPERFARTKTAILDVYDALAKAIEIGEPYRTVLDSPLGDGPRHPVREDRQ